MCGLFAVACLLNPDADVLAMALEGLTTIAHRGNKQGVGAAVSGPNGPLAPWKRDDSINNLTPADVAGLRAQGYCGNPAGAHLRYATASDPTVADAQPHESDPTDGKPRWVVASNGDIPFYDQERQRLEDKGYSFASCCDAEVIANLLLDIYLANGGTREAEEIAVMQVVEQLEAAFSMWILAPSGRMFAARDLVGFRPLWSALDNEYFYLCSEPAPLHVLSHPPVEVRPGHIIIVDPFAKRGAQLRYMQSRLVRPKRFCLMEVAYFSRPDSYISGTDRRSFHWLRYQLGLRIGQQWIKDVLPKPDLVCPIPFSGNPSAQGYGEALKIPYLGAIFKNRFVGRVFQIPDGSRLVELQRNISIIPEHVMGKKVAVSDDTNVRGHQGKHAVQMLFEAGAAEVYQILSMPPYIHRCRMGINTPDEEKLIAFQRSIEEVRQIIGADILYYPTIDMVYEVLGHRDFCAGCFTGEYPISMPQENRKEI